MADTYTQLYIQIVFAVQRRERLIHPDWEDDLYKYITGIIQEKNQTLLAINGVPDHIHILIRIKPTCNLSDLVREIKKASSNFINDKNLSPNRFSWQNGFGAFSYNQRDVEMIINYIKKQKEHHREKNFQKEYLELLGEFEIDYKEEYLFDWIEE
jgi:REP element-mobilizing transposase RayT